MAGTRGYDSPIASQDPSTSPENPERPRRTWAQGVRDHAARLNNPEPDFIRDHLEEVGL